MKTSETIGEIAKALAAAQAEMSPAKKRAKNPHFRSNYADLESVIEAAAVIHDHGLAFVQSPSTDVEGGLVCVLTRLIHTSGEWIECAVSARPAGRGGGVDLSPQPVGSAITYLKRYGLQSLLGIPSADDDGNAASLPPRRRENRSKQNKPTRTAASPATQPAPAQRPTGHDPSWSEDEARFRAKCKKITGYDYSRVAAWCEFQGTPRPSAMDKKRRNKVLEYLASDEGQASIFEYASALDFAASEAGATQ